MAGACGTAVACRGEHPVRTNGAHSAGTVAPAEVAPCGAQRHGTTCATTHQLHAARRVLKRLSIRRPMACSRMEGQALAHTHSMQLGGYCNTRRDAHNVSATSCTRRDGGP